MILLLLEAAAAAALAAAPALPGAPAAPLPATPAATTAAPATEGDEIVVTARRGKCELQMAQHTMTSAQVNAYAKLWALGRPVRVVEPAGADERCRIRIMFELAHKGVRVAEFVTRSEDQ